MPRFALALLLPAALLFAAGSNANAADTAMPAVTAPAKVTVVPAPVPLLVEPAPVVVAPEVVTKPPPRVAYGCKRVWRCDAQVCEWRRGCWGVYGYMEGPYYSQELAKRQWVRDGWPVPARERVRY